MPRKKYTDKEKIAYYKKLARQANVSGSGSYSMRRKRRYVKGRGDYSLKKDFFSAPDVGGALGGAGGALIGNLLAPGIGAAAGGALGQGAGTALGHLFKRITGYGDYTVKQNSLIYPDAIVPSFGDDSIRVRKREFIANLNSTASVFTNKSFPINPGLPTSFPWLSSIAGNYEQYRVNGMIYQYVSTSSEAIASTTSLGLGQVILATNYDAAADDFQDSPQMLNFMFSNSGRPSDHIMHAIECAPTDTAQKLYYVRTGSVPSGQDQRLFDLGNFQIAVDNMPASYNGMGQLWVSYDITFCKSVQNNLLGLSLESAQFKPVTSLTNANVFGSGGTNGSEWLPVDGSDLACYLDQQNIYFPPTLNSGYYMIQCIWAGSATAITSNTLTLTNCKLVKCWISTSQTSRQSPPNGVSSASLSQMMCVKLGTSDNVTQCVVGFSAGTLPTSLTGCDIIINQVNGDIMDQYVLN